MLWPILTTMHWWWILKLLLYLAIALFVVEMNFIITEEVEVHTTNIHQTTTTTTTESWRNARNVMLNESLFMLQHEKNSRETKISITCSTVKNGCWLKNEKMKLKWRWKIISFKAARIVKRFN
jgi:hypothetical protein